MASGASETAELWSWESCGRKQKRSRGGGEKEQRRRRGGGEAHVHTVMETDRKDQRKIADSKKPQSHTSKLKEMTAGRQTGYKAGGIANRPEVPHAIRQLTGWRL